MGRRGLPSNSGGERSCVNTDDVCFGLTLESSEEEAEGGIGSGVLSLFVGLLVPVLFNSLVQGQDVVVFLLALFARGERSSMAKSC